uniref:AtC3H23-like CCCH zinc finger domain-containing protein n=1 Tax=Physcomitrium patens TaxID=3218 RepID=A0A2K1L4M2_PHYPA|nr:hypothetical protein PHYPA_003782 [Physcomitrium patens]
MRERSHDWTEGPFAHPGEKARRWNPRRYEDSGTACREFRKRELSERRCVRVWVHLSIEYWLHLARYLDAAVQGWAELASSSVVFGAYVGAATVDACGGKGGTGSDDKRSEHKASRRVAASRCTGELRSSVEAPWSPAGVLQKSKMELILTPSTMILMEGEPVVQQVESGQRHRSEKPKGLFGPGLGELLIYGELL